ncbi:MAG: outer membrane beta-barrel protein [Nitrospirota bacterium]|nr:outer membrane beta-barrel protein [Nitrospirota bacterium]MDP2384226.1 outer membrane beta-barrel protein [Nitrospirota bacterium]MDP3596475.1 outer membrane beta-barrel protein [Nitrospirota bacterium]
MFRLVGACAIWGAWLLSAHAESYVAGQVGYTVAQDTTRGRVTDPSYVGLPGGTTASNLSLNNSLMYGMKLGHYFDSTPWLGVELESFMTTPHAPQQRVTLQAPGVGTVLINETGATNRLIVVAPNLVARYRAGAFEPYLGVGPGVFFLHQRQEPLTSGTTAYSQSSTRVGLNTQVGLRYRLTDHVSMFGEWKYNYVRFNLAGQADGPYAGINAVANLHHFVFGVGYHF